MSDKKTGVKYTWNRLQIDGKLSVLGMNFDGRDFFLGRPLVGFAQLRGSDLNYLKVFKKIWQNG